MSKANYKKMTPLNGNKTHPLKPGSLKVLKELADGPIPRQEINPGVASRLLIGGLVEQVDLPSTYKRNEPKWRSTKKDPPKIKEVVIISDGRSVTAGYRASSDREDYQYLDEDGANTCFIIPHVWMPLPSAKTVPKYVVDA